MKLYDYFIDSISRFFDWQIGLVWYLELGMWLLEFTIIVWLICGRKK